MCVCVCERGAAFLLSHCNKQGFKEEEEEEAESGQQASAKSAGLHGLVELPVSPFIE